MELHVYAAYPVIIVKTEYKLLHKETENVLRVTLKKAVRLKRDNQAAKLEAKIFES